MNIWPVICEGQQPDVSIQPDENSSGRFFVRPYVKPLQNHPFVMCNRGGFGRIFVRTFIQPDVFKEPDICETTFNPFAGRLNPIIHGLLPCSYYTGGGSYLPAARNCPKRPRKGPFWAILMVDSCKAMKNLQNPVFNFLFILLWTCFFILTKKCDFQVFWEKIH